MLLMPKNQKRYIILHLPGILRIKKIKQYYSGGLLWKMI